MVPTAVLLAHLRPEWRPAHDIHEREAATALREGHDRRSCRSEAERRRQLDRLQSRDHVDVQHAGPLLLAMELPATVLVH